MSVDIPPWGLIVSLILAAPGAASLTDSTYLPADLEKGLVLYPIQGPELTVPIPRELSVSGFRSRYFGSGGRSIYGDSGIGMTGLFLGITKIDFRPLRKTQIPGSEGLGRITSLTVSPTGEKIFVAGSIIGGGHTTCGDFEINVISGTSKPLRIGRFPDCGGPVTSDGKLELQTLDGHLNILNLETGATLPLGKDLSEATWSPDGRWIAALKGTNHIVLIDATKPSRRKSLGKGEGQLVWSPDSKQLITEKWEFSCYLWLYGENTMEVIDVGTGRRHMVKSTHCAGNKSFVWLDREFVVDHK